MKYIERYQTLSDYQADIENFDYPHVSWVTGDNTVMFDPYHDYSKDYLTFEILESEPSRAMAQGITYDYEGGEIEYSLDGGDRWNSLRSGDTVSDLSPGDKVMFRGNNGLDGQKGVCHFTCTHRFNISGNLMSMYDADNFMDMTRPPGQAWGKGCFSGNTTLISAENLFMYDTHFGNFACEQMFAGCTSLTTAPALPATSLSRSCYQDMFNGCESLERAPELPATQLAYECYMDMFNGCSSLNYVRCLAADNNQFQCTYDWLKGVAREGIFDMTEGADFSYGTDADDGIPEGWTIYIDGQPQQPNDDF